MQLPVLETKARLITRPTVYVPPDTRLGVFPSKSAAGPDGGTLSVVLDLEGTLVKVSISADPDSPWVLKPGEEEGTFHLLEKNGSTISDQVRLQPTLMHGPGMAFIMLHSTCVYRCSYCVVPHLEGHDRKGYSRERWLELILKQSTHRDFRSVAITTGVTNPPERGLEDMEWLVARLRKALPEIPIGVEPYIHDLTWVTRLHDAGATEMKLNLETYDAAIFRVVRPGLDLEMTLKALEESVRVFGRGRVSSNLLIGMGESDQSILSGVDELARLGVAPVLRLLRVNEINRGPLLQALGRSPPEVSPARLVSLGQSTADLLSDHGLSTLDHETMCHVCGACDIVPQQDIGC